MIVNLIDRTVHWIRRKLMRVIVLGDSLANQAELDASFLNVIKLAVYGLAVITLAVLLCPMMMWVHRRMEVFAAWDESDRLAETQRRTAILRLAHYAYHHTYHPAVENKCDWRKDGF